MEIIIAGLTLGLMGSFHCIGMCGPIAIALPLSNENWFSKFVGALLYNIGRTITYGFLGLIFGIIGAGLSFAGFQKWVSITMGILMIVSVVFPGISRNINKGGGSFSFMNKIKFYIGKLFKNRSKSSLFLIGLLNGFLPCGLVYMALAGALATADLKLSILFMIMFGLGTIPMLFAISIIGNLATNKMRKIINKLIPVIVVLIGIIFILRGLSLGIPYISPSEEKLELNQENAKENPEHCINVIYILKPVGDNHHEFQWV